MSAEIIRFIARPNRGTSPTMGFSIGTPGVGATYGIGPYQVPGEWNAAAAGEVNGDISNTGFGLPAVETDPEPSKSGGINKPVRYLSKIASPGEASKFDNGTSAVPFTPRTNDMSYRDPAARTRTSCDPVRPSDPLPPPVFGLPDQSAASGDNMDDWFSRWIKPLIRQ